MKKPCVALAVALLTCPLTSAVQAAADPGSAATSAPAAVPRAELSQARAVLRPSNSAAAGKRSRANSEATAFVRAQAAAAEGDFALAARLFAEVEDSAAPEPERLRAEVELAHCLLALGFFDAATRRYDFVLRAGPHHPAYAEAVEGLLEINALTGDDVLVGAILDREYGEAFARLSADLLDRINALIGTMSLRAGRLDEARAFFDSVSPMARDARRVDYLAGLLAARSGAPEVALELFGRAIKPLKAPVPEPGEASLTAFASATARRARLAARERLGLSADHQISERELGELALLAQARTLYALSRFSEAVLAYERIPRFSRFWEASLLENGWARLQNEDDGGALGTLQALHAPQFAASFQPESWILKAIIYFTHCLHREARAALQAFEEIYGPQKEALRALLAEPHPPEFWLGALQSEGTLPTPIQRDLTANRRLGQLTASLARIAEEGERIRALEAWRGTSLWSEELKASVQSQELARRVAADFVEKRLRDALARLIGFDAQKEIIELEIARVETEEMESHFDRAQKLRQQALHRPHIDGDRQVHWPFQGEFWIDEIGHYRFTLKNGCRDGER